MTTQRTHEALEPSSVDMLARVVGEPSLANLAWALEHPEVWPEGFEWDYSECRSCAMGLAQSLWNCINYTRVRYTYEATANAFYMPAQSAKAIFIEAGDATHKPMADVLPSDVATLIHEYLAAREPAQGDAR